MPETINFWEQPNSGDTTNNFGVRTITRRYFLHGTDNYTTAYTHVGVNTPEADPDEDLPRADINLSNIDDNQYLWDVEVVYRAAAASGGLEPPPDFGEVREEWSLRPKKVRIFDALDHVASYGVGEDTPPDHKGKINVVDGKAEGIDVDRMEFIFRLRTKLEGGVMSSGYRRQVYSAKDSVNADNWRGFNPGEARFMGCNANQNADGDWDVVFEFLAEPNVVTPFNVGPVVVPQVEGHNVVWSESKLTTSGDPPKPSVETFAVHVEQVYREAPFGLLLGI